MRNPRTLFGDRVDDEFRAWLASDGAFDTVNRFVQLAREHANRNQRVPARFIIDIMRYYDEPPLAGFPNTIAARLARYVMVSYPDLADYFRTSELRAA